MIARSAVRVERVFKGVVLARTSSVQRQWYVWTAGPETLAAVALSSFAFCIDICGISRSGDRAVPGGIMVRIYESAGGEVHRTTSESWWRLQGISRVPSCPLSYDPRQHIKWVLHNTSLLQTISSYGIRDNSMPVGVRTTMPPPLANKIIHFGPHVVTPQVEPLPPH